MNINPEHISQCGLYCGTCGIYRATVNNDQKYLKLILRMYKASIPDTNHLTTEDLLCDGCQAEKRSYFCTTCLLRSCSKERKLKGCHQCESFPCENVHNFPVPTGREEILRSVPYRKQHGTEKWILDEEKRYYCKACDSKLFRGAKRCNRCKEPTNFG